MVKFQNIKKSLKEVKCFVKRTLMSKSNNEDEPHQEIKPRKKPTAFRRPSRTNPGAATSNAEEGFIPLAARDSQWVGIDFYNPHFRSPLDEEDDVEEVELQNLAADGIEAIYLLFPGLARVKPNSNGLSLKERESSSTTEITKLLVGQKADFRNMRSSKRLILTDSKLGSVPEVPLEEKTQSDTDVSVCTEITKKSVTDIESGTNCADDESEEPEQERRIKRLRKKSDIRMAAVASSKSFIPTTEDSKIQQSVVKLQKSSVFLSSDSSEIKQEVNEK